jgi:hypothetical protein
VNALEERLRHAARYRIEGWGDEVFLRIQPDNATYGIDLPVISGMIDKSNIYQVCNMPMSGGHRQLTRANSLPVTVVCEPYWEATETYTLENYVRNSGFWRGTTAPGDNWNEVDPAGNLTLAWEATIWEVMGRSLKWTLAPDPVNSIGINSSQIVVTGDTEYYFEVRGYHTAGCDGVGAYVYDDTHLAWIPASFLYFDNQDDAWEKLGVSFTTPVGCVLAHVTIERNAASSSPGDKTFYCDAVYLTEGTDAPTGWSSGRDLVNCLDDTAGNINVLCVTEIPGEVEAEVKLTIDNDASTTYLRSASRTRDDPHNFIWQLTPCAAYTTAEGGVGAACTPGLTFVGCLDSDKIVDATSPSGSRVNVSFAGTQTAALRCKWHITDDLASYYGMFLLLLIAKMEGTTDKATVYWQLSDEGNTEGPIIRKEISGTTWTLYDGFEQFSFPVGTRDNDLFGAGNEWQIRLYASTDGTPTDDLHIAGAFLVPIDEHHYIGGSGNPFGATADMIVKDMDGDRGLFAHSSVTDTYWPNQGLLGSVTLLSPEVENYLYVLGLGDAQAYTLTDGHVVSVEYRPRGKFLRGSNPA